jgi:hypothetical protein
MNLTGRSLRNPLIRKYSQYLADESRLMSVFPSISMVSGKGAESEADATFPPGKQLSMTIEAES